MATKNDFGNEACYFELIEMHVALVDRLYQIKSPGTITAAPQKKNTSFEEVV